MKMNFNEIQINSKEEVKINLNDISSFLYKSGFLNKNIISQDIRELLNGNSKYNITNIFEFNTAITIKEASSKYKELIKSINSIFKSDSKYTLESLYFQYIEYTGRKIFLNFFLNTLIMLNYILTNFTDLLNLENSVNVIDEFQLNKKISIFSIDKINDINDKNSLYYKLNEIYDKIEQNPEYKGDKVNKELIVLIYIMSLDGKLFIEDEIPNIDKLLPKFNMYNKLYISNIHLSIILYIQMILLININNTNTNNNKKSNNNISNYKNQFQELSRNELSKGNNNNFTFTVHNHMSRYNNKTQILSTNRKLNNNQKNINSEKNNIYNNLDIPNYYLFNEDIINNTESNNTKLILFQNYLKYFSFYALSKNKIQLDINLSFESIHEFMNITRKKNFFQEINDDIIYKLNLEIKDLKTKDNIISIFNTLNINELIFKFADTKNKENIEKISSKFIYLISKSNICYIQELVDTLINNNQKLEKSKSNRISNSLTIKDLFTQFDILDFYLIFFHKNTEIKKNPKTIHIKFNTFKCVINRDNKKIQIYFNFSLIKEKTLFHYLKHSSNILKLEEKYTEIISVLKEYKQYDSSIRLCQNNFISNQVSFIFTLLIKRVSDYVNENKLNQKIIILETKFNTFNPNMQVFIKDENMKLKIRLLAIKQLIQHPQFGDKFYVLENYLEDLATLWNLIVISDNESDFKLLRTFEDNKLFFYLTRDKSNISQNTEENYSTSEPNSDNNNPKSKKNLGVEYINVILYIKNDENIFSKAMSFIEDLASDRDSVLEYKFNLIYDRFFLESNILMEPRMKRSVKIMYSLIDDLYMIAKNIKNENDPNDNDENEEENEYYNYDIYIGDSFIAVGNFHIYDITEDQKYNKIIHEFLSILSSCIEFILYILKNKDIYIPKFLYILRTKKDNYYIFEYKESNIFIKKIKEFNSLISLDTKDCYPLFCFLSKKTQTNYTVSNDNFYDVFLRLFLNLNKVVESKEKLNEVFMQKIHKNIFYEYYDSFVLIAFTYESVNFFNDFLMQNDYLTITKGEKFDKCYIILTEENSKKIKNYEILLKNMKNEQSIIVKKIISFNFNFKPSYFYLNKQYSSMGFRKVEYLINEQISQVKYKIIPTLNNNLTAIYKIFIKKAKSKENTKKIVDRIKMFMVGNDKINVFNNSSKNFENILDEYIKEKNKMKAQKVEMRVYQLTEEAKNTENSLKNNKKDCFIF